MPKLNPRTVAMARTRGRDYREGWEDGVRAAARFAGVVAAEQRYPCRFENVVLSKFNLHRPRRKATR